MSDAWFAGERKARSVCEGAAQYNAGHAVGLRGVGDGDRAREHPQSEQSELLEATGRYDCLQISNVGLNRHVVNIPVRQAGAAQVVTHERGAFGEALKELARASAVPLDLQVSGKTGDVDDWNAPIADRRVGDGDAVGGGAECDALLHEVSIPDRRISRRR